MSHTFAEMLQRLDDELTDYRIPIWEVPAWAGAHDLAIAVELCEDLLAHQGIELVWMQGHYDKPAPHGGPKRIDRAAPTRVTADMFQCPADMLTPEPYLAIEWLDRTGTGW